MIRKRLFLLLIACFCFQISPVKAKRFNLEMTAEVERTLLYEIKPVETFSLDYPPYKTAVSVTGKYLFMADRRHNLLIYDLAKGEKIFSREFPFPIYSLAANPKMENIVCFADKAGKIYVFDTQKLKLIKLFNSSENSISDLAFSPDGTVLAAADFRGVMTFYSADNYERITEFRPHNKSIYSISFSPDSSLIATGSQDTAIKITKLGQNRAHSVLKRHKSLILEIMFSPGGDFLASAGADSQLCLWKKNDEQFEYFFYWPHREWVTSLGFYNQYLFSGSREGNIRVFNYKNKKLKLIFRASYSPIMEIIVHPPTRSLFVATRDNLMIYNVESIVNI